MAKSQQFSASVNFGASLDGSVGRTLDRLTGGIDDVSSTSLKAMNVQTKWMRELQSGSATSAKKIKVMEDATVALLKKQAALEKEIREGKKSGDDVSNLVYEYKKLAAAISRADDEMNKLNDERKRERDIEDKEAKSKKRKDLLFGRTRDFFGKVKSAPDDLIDGSLSAIGSLPFTIAEGIGSAIKWAVPAVLGGATGIIGGAIALNQQTAESAGLAKSYGLSIKQFQGMGILARQAGLNAENGGDLAEEFVNKLKEQGNEKTLNPMLMQIGFTKRSLSKLSREDAFNQVMSRLSRMKDTGAAASLADQLMGGEANKFLTYIHSTGKSFEGAMKDAQRYNLLTQEGADGAMRANMAVGNLWGVALTGMEDTVGKISYQLAPMVDDAALQLSDWIKGMQPAITQAVTDWLKPDQFGETGPQRLWDSIVKFGKGVEEVGAVILAVAQKLKWIIPQDTTTPKSQVQADARAMAYNEGMKEADKSPLNTWVNLPWLFGGRKDFVDDYANEHAETFETMLGEQDTAGSSPNVSLSRNGLNNTNNNTFNFSVTLQPGTPEDMAHSLNDEFKKLLGGQAASPAFDIPG